MTTLAIAHNFPTFRVATSTLGETLFEIFNTEETTSFSLDREFTPRVISDFKHTLLNIYSECSIKDWDGYGAKAISYDAVVEALEFINMLPISFQLPEILPEPDGDIGFEWNYGDSRTFVASFKGTGVVTYAGLLGSEELRVRGTEILDSSLLQYIERILSRIS